MMELLKKSDEGLFATRTLTGHLVRGAVAFGLLWLAIAHQHTHALGAVAAGVAALVVMRGCPACWAIGLVETVRQRWREGAREQA
jgi:hypothetical protein